MFARIIKSRIIYTVFLLLLLLPIYLLLYKIYIPKVNAFGCFDDCFNIVAGFFMTRGKRLYSEIFFNHQILTPSISFIIQSVFHPINIYELILRHRQTVLLFGFLFNGLIIVRFKLVGFMFVLLYELTKFYLFGDRFLAEGITVYPLVYLTGLVWEKYQQKKLYLVDYVLSGIFAWFIIFMREPLTLVVMAIYFLILTREKRVRKTMSFGIFLVLTILVFSSVNLKDYFNGLMTSLPIIVKSESESNNLLGLGLIKVFFYPIYLLFGGKWNIFREVLVGLDLIFLVSLLFVSRFYRNFKLLIIIFLLLGLANLRVIPVGEIFYGAFHMLPWYGMFIIITCLMVKDVYLKKKKVGLILSSLLIIIFGYYIVNPSSFIHDKVSTHNEFITNYGHYLQIGEVIKILSDSTDTLFLDGADDLIYWQADRLSPYKYAWFTGFMNGLPKYINSRFEMFENNPPDFYYRYCSKIEVPSLSLPGDKKVLYQQLYSNGNPTCLYVKKEKIPQIPAEKWQKAKEFLYELPPKLSN